MALEIIALIVLALISGLVGIGMVIRERFKKVAGYAVTGAGYAAKSARQVGGYARNAYRYARSKFPEIDPQDRERMLRETRSRYESFDVSEEMAPITELFSVFLNLGEYAVIGRYLNRSRRRREAEKRHPSGQPYLPGFKSLKGRKK